MRTVVAALVLLVAGCAGNSTARAGNSTSPEEPGGSVSPSGSVPASHGPGALVLRTMTSGGFAGLGGPGTLPDFSLYADGTAITKNLTEYHLTPQAQRRLVAEASKAGLATPRTLDDPHIADATYTVLTFMTGGRPRTSRIIQVGEKHRNDPAVAFVRRLDPASWPRSDLAAATHPYRAARDAVLASPAEGTGPTWPYRPLGAGTHVGSRTCTVLPAKDGAKAAAQQTWRDRGQTFRVSVRPLLPDESGCAALSSP
jgi:hypothetical protein